MLYFCCTAKVRSCWSVGARVPSTELVQAAGICGLAWRAFQGAIRVAVFSCASKGWFATRYTRFWVFWLMELKICLFRLLE